MDGEVARELAVRVAVRDLDGAAVVAQERDVGQGRDEPVGEARDGDGDAAALAHAVHGDALGVDAGHRAHGVDRAHAVGEDAAVVVVVRVLDAAREDARDGGPRPGRVGRATAAAPLAALPARVDDEVRVPGVRPREVLVGQPATAAVPEELDDRGERGAVAGRGGAGGLGGPHEPRLDGLAGEPGERHVVDDDQVEAGLHALQPHRPGRVPARLARLREGPRPEGVEVGGLVERGGVGLELGEGQVEERHGAILRSIRLMSDVQVRSGRL